MLCAQLEQNENNGKMWKNHFVFGFHGIRCEQNTPVMVFISPVVLFTTIIRLAV